MTDAQLIRSVQQGSQAAMEALYERYLPPVWRYAYTQLRGDWQGAQDVVSETFLALIRGAGELDPDGGPLCAWLMGVARHKLADYWRQGRSDDPPAPGETQASPDATTAIDTREQVAAAMAALEDQQRLVLEWKYIEGLSVREIAQRLGRSAKATEALLFRARNSFRAACGEPGK